MLPNSQTSTRFYGLDSNSGQYELLDGLHSHFGQSALPSWTSSGCSSSLESKSTLVEKNLWAKDSHLLANTNHSIVEFFSTKGQFTAFDNLNLSGHVEIFHVLKSGRILSELQARNSELNLGMEWLG
jgi:hypothetical protein